MKRMLAILFALFATAALAQQWPSKPIKIIVPYPAGGTSDKRDATFPNVPTMAEAGVPGLEVYSWQAFAAPKGLPRDVHAKLQSALVTALKDPEVTKKFNDIGFEVVANSPADFLALLNAELARWKQVVDAGGIKQTD